MSEIELPKRNEAGQYVKGYTGNPAGRVQDVAAVRLKTWATDDLRRIYDRIWQLIDDEETKCTTKASLLLSLLDRAAGKVKHQVDVKRQPADEGAEEVTVMTGKRLFEQIERFEKVLAAKDAGVKVQAGIVRVIEGEVDRT